MNTPHTPSVTSSTTAAALPVLFVSHGAPLFALEPGSTGPALTRWGAELKAQYPACAAWSSCRRTGWRAAPPS